MIRFGKYRGVGPLAQGHVSLVYLCEDPDLQAPVAVKAFALRSKPGGDDVEVERWRRRFVLEAQWLGRIEHPNIVFARALATTGDGIPYYVMPYLPANLGYEIGRDTPPRGRRRLVRRPLPPRRALEVLEGLLDGLAGLHAAGLAHRDVKPANVLLTAKQGGRVKLCDLGMARFPDDDAGDDPAGLGAAIGTEGYAAPEVRRDPAGADARADVYGAAAVAYRMLTGVVPPEAPEARATALAALDVSEAFRGPLLSALSEGADDRPKTASDFRRRLAAARAALETVQRTSDDGRLVLSVRAARRPSA